MTTTVVGGASTQSRARRPLPAGVDSAETITSSGVTEVVAFRRGNVVQTQTCLTWVVGQGGLLWGSPEFPNRVLGASIEAIVETPGSYGHIAEEVLALELDAVYGDLFGDVPLGARFFANGSDACSAAARIARAITGRDVIASSGYHGSHSDYAHLPQYLGVPLGVVNLHCTFEWGDVAAMRALAGEAAALVVEVPPVPDEEARDFLRACQIAANANGALLVIDDVVLGFRLALGGSLERYGVIPDLVVLGKAMSILGGVSAVIGPEPIAGRLGVDVFYSTTFGGHPFFARAAADTIRYLRLHEDDVYGERGHLMQIGARLMDGLNAVFVEEGTRAEVVGQPVRSVVRFTDAAGAPDEAARRRWCALMIEAGVIVDRPFFPTLAHTFTDVERTLAAARKACRAL